VSREGAEGAAMMHDDMGSPLFLGHIDGRVLLWAFLLWEILYRVSKMAIGIAVTLPRVVAGGNENRDARTEKLVREGPSYIVSLVNAVLAVYVGVPVLFVTIGGAVDDQYSGRSAPSEWMCAVFLAYVVHDLVHIVLAWPRLGRWDVVFHHVMFFCCGIVCGYHALYILPFTWLTLGETSTVFLNIRWFLLTSGRPSTHVVTWLCNLLFALSFAVTRFVIYGAGIAHMAYHHDVLVGIWEAHPSVAFVTVLIGLGFLLNIVWLRKIIARVWRSKTGAMPRKEE